MKWTTIRVFYHYFYVLFIASCPLTLPVKKLSTYASETQLCSQLISPDPIPLPFHHKSPLHLRRRHHRRRRGAELATRTEPHVFASRILAVIPLALRRVRRQQLPNPRPHSLLHRRPILRRPCGGASLPLCQVGLPLRPASAHANRFPVSPRAAGAAAGARCYHHQQLPHRSAQDFDFRRREGLRRRRVLHMPRNILRRREGESAAAMPTLLPLRVRG